MAKHKSRVDRYYSQKIGSSVDVLIDDEVALRNELPNKLKHYR